MWEKLEPLLEPLISIATRGIGAVVLLAVVAVIYFLARRGLTTLRAKGALPDGVGALFERSARGLALIVGALLVLQQFGLLEYAWTTLTAFLAMVAVGFVAVWSVLSNFFCALILMIARPFDVGDTVEFVGDNARGKVIQFNLLYTTVRDADDETQVIQIPNNFFFQKMIRRRMGQATVSLDQQLKQKEAKE